MKNPITKQMVVTSQSGINSNQLVESVALFDEAGAPVTLGGGSQTPTGDREDPIILAPAKWLWTSTIGGAAIHGLVPNFYGINADLTGNILSPMLTDNEFPPTLSPYLGSIPTPIDTWPGLNANKQFNWPGGSPGSPVPFGSADNVLVGIQLGDRVVFADHQSAARAGVYIVTNLGSPSTSWELTRAADLTLAQSHKLWMCEIEGTPSSIISVPTHIAEPTPDDTNSISVLLSQYGFVFGVGALANGWASIAIGTNAIALSNGISLGNSSSAKGSDSSAFGNYAQASGDNATALGTSSVSSGYNATAIGRNAQASGAYSQASGLNVNATEEGVHIVGSYFSDDGLGPTVGNGGAAVIQGIEETQTASFALAKKHIGRFIPCDHATVPIVVTIPKSTFDGFGGPILVFPIGSMIELGCLGAADVSFVGEVDVTLLGTTTATTAGQVLKARKISHDVWWVSLTS